MSSIVDDIRQGWLPRYGAIAQIIILNVGVFLTLAVVWVVLFAFQAAGAFDAALRYLALPSALLEVATRPWSLITHAFLHYPKDILHILFNMLWLFWIGVIYRVHIGDRHIWPTFALGVAAGVVFYLAAMNLLPAFAEYRFYLNGASAGVNAIIVAAATLTPNYTIPLLLLGPVRLKWIALVLVVLDFISIPNGNAGGMFAHLGGALMGFLYVQNLKEGRDFSQPFVRLGRLFQRRDRSARVLHVAHVQPRAAADAPTQAEIDRILDKIKQVGYEKLTKEEKQTLFKASQ